MQFKHALAAVSEVFDEENLVSAAGLVPAMRLAEMAGLGTLAQERLTVPSDKGANAGLKVSSLVAGMLAGADSIDDMNVLRHGGMSRLFDAVYAPSTLGSFLRSFQFGHVRQLDGIASRFLQNLSSRAPLLQREGEHVFVDLDDTIIEVHGYAKQGAGFGYSGVRGLNALLATASTPSSAPVILGQRLRRGAAGSPRGAARIVADALATLRRLHKRDPRARVLVRADSAFYGHATIGTARKAGADVSVTVRMDPAVKAAIAAIPDDAWTTIEYPDAIFDEHTGRWISRAEVAETPFTAFSSRKKTEQVPGRLIVRRIPDLNPKHPEPPTLFDTWRHHAFFTTSTLDTVTADKTHRAHAVIEQVHADLKNSALAHLPSGHYAANAAWLVLAVIAFNLTRAAATLTAGNGPLARATTATIRRTLIHVPARVARSARRVRLHLPRAWPWQTAFARLFAITHAPPPPAAP